VIRFRFDRADKGLPPIVFVGLSDGNVTRLRAGQPIRVKADDPVAQFDAELVIYHGATEVELTRELEDAGVLPAGAAEKTAAAMRERGEYRHEAEP
jgi:hypothetical protein